MTDITNDQLLEAIQEAAWQRAKGELYAVVALSRKSISRNDEHMKPLFDGIEDKVAFFIETVEDDFV